MRYRDASSNAPVKRNLLVGFTETELSSCAGLELLMRCLCSNGLNQTLSRWLKNFASTSLEALRLLNAKIVGGENGQA